ncbi:MAG: electron transport complex subunit RsxC [Gammaproteobacteria bacterium]
MGLLDLFKPKTFSHGIHPEYHKELTAGEKIRRLPFPETLIIHLDQHIGKPAKPIVAKRDEVVRGQPIAEADGHLSVPIHAPATGRIRGIELMPHARGQKTPAIILDVYKASAQEVLWSEYRDMGTADHEQLLQWVKDTGVAGMGGAAFPSHVKLKVPKDATVDTLVVNGCECEPYLTCDHRVMLEQTDDLIRGVRFAMQAAGTPKAIIGVEDNKMDAVEAIRAALPTDGSISVEAVETKYPQGSEKMLIKSLLDREVPNGGIPARIGVVVVNVGTAATLGQLLPKGQGMIERVVTVTGPGVEKPGNYRVPIGTPVSWVLKHAGYQSERGAFVLGGPMMGPAVSTMDTPISKGTSGILVLDEQILDESESNTWACIKCGRCVQACPMHLNPAQLGQLAGKRLYETMAGDYHLNDCFECGCCSYVCPSHIPLVQYFRIAKAINREKAS